MIERTLRAEVERRLAQFPAVVLLGPRQCGKTTLAKSLGGAYYDLEDPAERLRLDLAFPALAESPGLTVLDEAHLFPEALARLRGEIDRHRERRGRFLLLGSISLGLMHRVGESLAGRTANLQLTPLLLAEAGAGRLAERWLYGGFPGGGVLDGGAAYPVWHRSYLENLLFRDLPLWGLPAKPATSNALLRAFAALHGQAFNATKVASEAGVSRPTVATYADYFEGSYLLRLLRPWSANLGKRLAKTPKLYLRDSGLLHSVWGVSSLRQLLGQPWAGASWEGFVIEEILGLLTSWGEAPEPFFFRTADGHELDLLLEWRGRRWAFEIKLTSAPDAADLGRARHAAALCRADRLALVSQAPGLTAAGDAALVHPAALGDYLRQALAET